ncbi:MAG: cytochrome-c oxidase, cbb3-type subunit II [Burkholderiaceae bacterium]|jgi:cytochrome c oxidase cbb3-type subunit 2|nr:cytochrome-c oxidase, cbb3-type subunit II [Burkholderiaceae bacterium]
MKFTHALIEKNLTLMIVLIIAAISVGGLVEIVPLFFQKSTTEPVDGLKPYGALELVGRDVYIREGCSNCHSQMIRPFRAETERYGHYSVAGEFVYDRPFLWGSKRTGPDLARVGGRYSDEWHRVHLTNPRDLVPESNMPGYPWLSKAAADDGTVGKRMSVLRKLGHPYSDEDIAGAPQVLKERTEMDALIAYLQVLGTSIRSTAR